MKLTQEQVIAWAREAGIEGHRVYGGLVVHHSNGGWINIQALLERITALAYEAGRKDENEALTAGLEEVMPSGHHSLQLVYVTKTAADKARAAIRARREQ